MAHAKRILVIANYPSYSHQIVYRNLYLELNKQGYEIVFIITDLIKNFSLAYYREIDLKYFYNFLHSLEFKKVIFKRLSCNNF